MEGTNEKTYTQSEMETIIENYLDADLADREERKKIAFAGLSLGVSITLLLIFAGALIWGSVTFYRAEYTE